MRIQYVGERAKVLMSKDESQIRDYYDSLRDDLSRFGFPVPEERRPISQSGFMLCIWHVPKDSVRLRFYCHNGATLTQGVGCAQEYTKSVSAREPRCADVGEQVHVSTVLPRPLRPAVSIARSSRYMSLAEE